MSGSDSYGEAFGRRLNAHATSFVARSLPKTTIAVTELRYDNPQKILSTPPIPEDAFLVAVHLKHYPRYEYWENGKAAPPSVLRPGETIIYDVKRRPTFHLNHPFHSIHFYFPRAALDALADEAGARRIDELRYLPAVSHQDPVLRGIAETLVPMFRNADQVNRLFMDHVMLSVGHHVASTYGGMRSITRSTPGMLTPYQERRAKELLADNLTQEMTLAAVAAECGLSLAQFSKAFRRTVGVSPHKWTIQRRIDRAKALLRDTPMSLAEVAIECGFSDQSHFTRFFSVWVGVSPGIWRRTVRG